MEHECTETDRLARIEETINQIHRKLFESNGERALVEVIRENTEWRIRMNGYIKKAVAWIIGIQVGGHGLREIIDFLMK